MLEKLFLSVLNMSITATLVIFVVLLVRVPLKKAPKVFSYALWAVVLFRLLCPFSFESAIGLLPINKAPISQDIVYSTEPQIDTGLNVIDNLINPMLPAPNNPQDSINPLQIWAFIGGIIWGVGILVMLIYSVIQFVKLKQKLIGATPLHDNIYLADHISSPFVIGFIKPKIYLPSSLSKGEQTFIILHEQCHIKRYDYITRILSFVALAIHWFNPLVWLFFILSGKDMEMSCDEAVMKKMNTDIRAEYSNSLLRFASGKKIIAATPLAFGEGDTKDRVKNVMKYKKPLIWVSLLAISAVLVLAIGLISNQKTNPIPKQDGAVSVENLWKHRTEYVGDNVSVGNILFELDFPDNMQYKNFELKTKEQPYEIIVHFEGIDDALKSVDNGDGQKETTLNIDFAKLEENAKIIFSLVGNVEKITFSVNRKEGGTLTNQYNRNDYQDFFTKTAEYEGFQAVLYEILGDNITNTLADFEKIEIGTAKDKIRTQFGEPNNMLSGMHGDTYIVGDKKVTIYYGAETNSPVTEIKISDYTKIILTHDEAVVLALTSNSDQYLQGECFAEGHIILGYDDSDATETKIYALVATAWYGFENENFVNVSGASFPAVITLNNDNTVSIEEPLDGGGYAKSIEKMFPKEYHDRVFNYQDSDRENLTKQQEKYAKEYLSKIGRDAKIGDHSDFDYKSPTDLGVSVEVSNMLQDFYKQHSYYPSFLGNRERIEGGTRMVYEQSYHETQNEIRFTKYLYEAREKVEQFVFDSITGKIVE